MTVPGPRSNFGGTKNELESPVRRRGGPEPGRNLGTGTEQSVPTGTEQSVRPGTLRSGPNQNAYGQNNYGQYQGAYPNQGEQQYPYAAAPAGAAGAPGSSGGNKNGLLFGIIGAVVAVLVIAGGLFFFLGGDEDDDDDRSTRAARISEETTETTSERPSTVTETATETVSPTLDFGLGPSYSPGEWGYGLDVVTECDPPSGIVFVASGSYATTCVFAENIAAELVGYSPASDASVPFTAYDDLLSRDSSGTCDRIEDGDGAYVYECTTDFGDVAYVRP